MTREDLWAARLTGAQRYLSYVLLGLSLVLGAVSTGAGFSSWSVYGWTVVVSVVAAVWTYLLDTRYPGTEQDSTRATVFFVGRWVLAAVLVVANPWFGIYAFGGYIDALRLLSFRRAVVGIVATAALTAISQLAGVPEATPSELAAFGLLWLMNAGLATGFSYYGLMVERQNEQRRTVIAELEETNTRLHAGAHRERGTACAACLASPRGRRARRAGCGLPARSTTRSPKV